MPQFSRVPRRSRHLRGFLCATAIPLALALHWAALHTPIDESDYWIETDWIDDQHLAIRYQFLPYRQGIFRPYQCVFREYLVDCENHTRTETTDSQFVREDPPDIELACDSFSTSWVPHTDFFFATTSVDMLQWYDESTGTFVRSVDWIEELTCPAQLRPPPLPVFQDDVEMLVLYRSSQAGPVEVAHWPMVALVNRDSSLQLNSKYIASLRLDAGTIDVRKASTGKIISSVPLPADALPNDFEPRWRLLGSTITLYSIDQKTPLQAIDVETGDHLPVEGSMRGLVRALAASTYITTEHRDYMLPEDLAKPDVIQFRSRPTGDIYSLFYVDGSYWESLEFTADERELKCVDHQGRIYFLDSPTGTPTKFVHPTRWQLGLGLAVALFALLWLGLLHYEWHLAGWLNGPRLVLLTTGAIAFLSFRVTTTGHPTHYDRLAWQSIYAISFAWFFWGILWLLNSRGRAWIRWLAAFSLILLGSWVFENWMENPRLGRYVMYHTAFTCSLMLSLAFIIRFFQPGVVSTGRQGQPKPQIGISLATLFWLTTCAAILAVWATRTDWQEHWNFLGSAERCWQLIVDVSLRVAVLFSAWFAVTHFRRYRFLGPLAVVATLILAISAEVVPGFFRYDFDVAMFYFSYDVISSSFRFVPIVIVAFIGFAPITEHKTGRHKPDLCQNQIPLNSPESKLQVSPKNNHDNIHSSSGLI